MPEALAYASIAGVSPVVGLYAAPAGAARSTPRSAAPATSSSARCRRRRRCRRRPSPTSTTGGPDDVLAFTAVLALVTGVLALAAGLLRLGLPRQLHLRAGAQGLHHRPRPDDHHRPGAQAARHREGGGRLLRAAVGRDPPPRRHAGAARSPSASRRSPWSSGCGARARRARLARRRRLRCRRRGAVRPRRQGRRDRRRDRQRTPALGLPDGVGSDDYLRAAGAAAGIMLVGFAEGLGAAKTYAAREPLRDRRQPRAARARRGQPGQRVGQRHGRQRQPLEDRRQRLGGRPLAGVRARRRRC